MSEYTITLKGGILDAKHRKAMGESIWLYIWLIDKMTKIDQASGVGKVWNTKPVRYSDVSDVLDISRATYLRWIKTLIDAGYIETTRTPNGLQIRVNKAEKYFGNKKRGSITYDTSQPQVMYQKRYSDVADMTHRSITYDTSNIRQYKDNTKTIGKIIEEEDNRGKPSPAKERLREMIKKKNFKIAE